LPSENYVCVGLVKSDEEKKFLGNLEYLLKPFERRRLSGITKTYDMMRLSTRLLVVAAAVGTSASGSEQSLLRRMAGDGANDVTEEFPRGAKNGNDKFMDALKSVTDEQVRSLLCRGAAMGSQVYVVILLFPISVYRK
jgi:hypothetical protein